MNRKPKPRGGRKSGVRRTRARSTSGSRSPSRSKLASAKFFDLRLYVAGKSARSLVAIANLKRICEEHLEGRYRIEVIDLVKRPQLARGDQILALPTLVRRLPEPIRKLVGDLSNTDQTLVGLDIRPRSPRG